MPTAFAPSIPPTIWVILHTSRNLSQASGARKTQSTDHGLLVFSKSQARHRNAYKASSVHSQKVTSQSTMATPVCAIFSAFMLVDFQGHVLDLANNVNPIISQTRNPTLTANQQWSLATINGGHAVLASGMSGPQGAVVLSWDTSASTSPLFMQALGAPTTSIAFELHCVNSTSASFIDAATGLALTAWPMESGSTITPVTFESFTG
ncbi:hypothetical protein DFH08DRAFT_1011201 [Mycena albidolilacea]|uniref:Uncharacterized protein n=1 Tax=Mycena albidolilacea TaxID=1033008 RepID=A0AAD7EPN6_9AGAR|nr:hypothetical protein DFH08DRAFT_1011201 [Mycena albidolilacea]